MIVFWVPLGGLGNLIFQYQAMLKNCPSASRFVMPATELPRLLMIDTRCVQIPVPKVWETRFACLWGNVLGWLAKVGVLGLIEPETVLLFGAYSSEIRQLKIRQGWFRASVFRGFFQSRDQATPPPILADGLIDRVRGQFAKLPVRTRVAIHMRFGDYVDWSVLGQKGAVLPINYYQNAMLKIIEHVDNPCFVIFSDDLNSARELLGEASNLHYYQGESSVEDLVAISLCEHAIISASTFAWWGGALIRNPDKIVIAPKFWLGFKSNHWYPLTMQDSEFVSIVVSPNASVE